MPIGITGFIGGAIMGGVGGGLYGGMTEGRDTMVSSAIGGAFGGGIVGMGLARGSGVAGIANRRLGWAGVKMTQARKGLMMGAYDNARKYGRGRVSAMGAGARAYKMGMGGVNRAAGLIGRNEMRINKWGGTALTVAGIGAGSYIGRTVMSSNGTSGRRRRRY